MSRSAIVIGGSMAGMLAAAALSQSVDKVTVLERDTLPGGPEPRKGLPQGHHAHILLPSGRDAIERLIPGVNIRERLRAAGANEASLTSGIVTLGPEGWYRRWRHNSHLLTTCSRGLLDWAVREAVLGIDGVTLRTGNVVALRGSAQRITGVRLDTPDGQEAELSADVVIDASGRGSRAVHWLGQLGITHIPESIVDSGLVYASRLYQVPEGAEKFPPSQVTANPFSGEPGQSALLLPIEGNRWLVSLGGTRGGEPPADPGDFIRFALGLRHPIVGQLISGARPLSDVVLNRSTRNGRKYFEKAPTWPEGFVVLGDANATYNPVYGQGMSVAALGAQALRQELQQTGLTTAGFARRVQQAAAKPVEAAWAMSTSQDRWFPGVVGNPPTIADRLLTRYTRRMTRVATSSYRVSNAMCYVTTLQEDAIRLVRPSLLLATLAGPVLPALSGPPLTGDEGAILHSVDRTA
ncbi:NAD(P)/FAD-dependent oxidoreductase [Streptomyces xiangluensis]|uniref:NAD(P)/FAD-dependent oxidoreductase n=1 Tax=Streptomyces xiangluensis TaxID=2665720 RepID=A0ABV8YYA3_9ACTN